MLGVNVSTWAPETAAALSNERRVLVDGLSKNNVVTVALRTAPCFSPESSRLE